MRRPMTRPAVHPRLALVAAAALLAAACAVEPGQVRREARAVLGLGGDARATLRLTGAVETQGPARVSCGPDAGAHGAFRLRFRPEGDPGIEVTAVVGREERPGALHALPGERDEAPLTVRRLAGGALRESPGTAVVRLDTAASPRAGAHAAAGSLRGEYSGAAGAGLVEATFERCPYFG
jgi:hypothetical protein